MLQFFRFLNALPYPLYCLLTRPCLCTIVVVRSLTPPSSCVFCFSQIFCVSFPLICPLPQCSLSFLALRSVSQICLLCLQLLEPLYLGTRSTQFDRTCYGLNVQFCYHIMSEQAPHLASRENIRCQACRRWERKNVKGWENWWKPICIPKKTQRKAAGLDGPSTVNYRINLILIRQ